MACRYLQRSLGLLAIMLVGGPSISSMAAAEDKSQWGDLKGQVVWAEDEIPAPKELAVTGDNMAHCLSKGPLFSQDWVINKENKGIQYVFVWLAPQPPTDVPPPSPSCRSIPP